MQKIQSIQDTPILKNERMKIPRVKPTMTPYIGTVCIHISVAEIVRTFGNGTLICCTVQNIPQHTEPYVSSYFICTSRIALISKSPNKVGPTQSMGPVEHKKEF